MSSGPGQVVVVGRAQEAEAVRQRFEHAFREQQAALLGARAENLEDQLLLAHAGRAGHVELFGDLRQLRHAHVLERPQLDDGTALGRRAAALTGFARLSRLDAASALVGLARLALRTAAAPAALLVRVSAAASAASALTRCTVAAVVVPLTPVVSLVAAAAVVVMTLVAAPRLIAAVVARRAFGCVAARVALDDVFCYLRASFAIILHSSSNPSPLSADTGRAAVPKFRSSS